MHQIVLPDLNLQRGERMICEEALARGGSINEAAQLLGITRHALSRRITKHEIAWPRKRTSLAGQSPPEPTSGLLA